MSNSPPPKSWRDVLPIHPAAELFPRMSESELRELGEDIKANGLRASIVLYEGKLLDGRNRLDAMELVGIEYSFLSGTDPTKWRGLGLYGRNRNRTSLIDCFDGDPYTCVISANIHRRHLTAEQKRELIAKLLKAKPEQSDRQVAKQTKTSPTTVGKIRKKSEATGDVSKVDTRTDTKGRKQPAKRKRRISKEEKEFHEKRKAREAKIEADWLADHPGKTVEDAKITGTCGDSDEGRGAWAEWSLKRYAGRDPLDTPSGPMPTSESQRGSVSAKDIAILRNDKGRPKPKSRVKAKR
jgi:hypothetical protein